MAINPSNFSLVKGFLSCSVLWVQLCAPKRMCWSPNPWNLWMTAALGIRFWIDVIKVRWGQTVLGRTLNPLWVVSLQEETEGGRQTETRRQNMMWRRRQRWVGRISKPGSSKDHWKPPEINNWDRERHRGPPDSREVTSPADSIMSDIKRNLLSDCVAGQLRNFIHLSCNTLGQ